MVVIPQLAHWLSFHRVQFGAWISIQLPAGKKSGG